MGIPDVAAIGCPLIAIFDGAGVSSGTSDEGPMVAVVVAVGDVTSSLLTARLKRILDDVPTDFQCALACSNPDRED